MSDEPILLHAFAYGEHLDGPHQRSLGFRLLAPAEPESWAAEVEALARSLQGTPYPDQWPPTELFASVLLADGQRLIAAARYGLVDHTPSQRRSGLELIGVIAPGNVGVAAALAIYPWLRQRRNGVAELRSLGGLHALAEVLAAAPAPAPVSEPVPVLPIRMWQEGALLFAATSPSDADRRLGLLEDGADGNWQWLPLVGADFPVQTYAQRGPLVAWTPHLAGVALKLDRKSGEPSRPLPRRRLVAGIAVATIIVLLAANLWATLALAHRLPAAALVPAKPMPSPAVTYAAPTSRSSDKFAEQMYQLLRARGAISPSNRSQLLGQYESLVSENQGWRVSSTEGKLALGATALLARRSPEQVEGLVRQALADKGYDPELINRACQLVREQLTNGK